MFRIPEDLDANEQQQFIDALNWYKQNPTAAPMKFVLAQKSRERVIRMGQEFGIDVYPGVPVPPNPTPDPFVVLQEFKPGDPRFVFTSQTTPVSAIPFRIAADAQPGWHGSASAAEFGTGGTGFAQAQISATPGDMAGAQGSGSNLTIDFFVGTGSAQPGALLYYNHRMAEGNAPRGTGFSVEFPKP